MNRITISAEHAPAAVGPYCHAKLCGDTLYCSGQLGLIPATGVLAARGPRICGMASRSMRV